MMRRTARRILHKDMDHINEIRIIKPLPSMSCIVNFHSNVIFKFFSKYILTLNNKIKCNSINRIKNPVN